MLISQFCTACPVACGAPSSDAVAISPSNIHFSSSACRSINKSPDFTLPLEFELFLPLTPHLLYLPFRSTGNSRKISICHSNLRQINWPLREFDALLKRPINGAPYYFEIIASAAAPLTHSHFHSMNNSLTADHWAICFSWKPRAFVFRQI